jgi:hypothetical protein
METLKKILSLPLLIPREMFIFILKHFYGCQIKVPHGKNRMGNKLYKLR